MVNTTSRPFGRKDQQEEEPLGDLLYVLQRFEVKAQENDIDDLILGVRSRADQDAASMADQLILMAHSDSSEEEDCFPPQMVSTTQHRDAADRDICALRSLDAIENVVTALSGSTFDDEEERISTTQPSTSFSYGEMGSTWNSASLDSEGRDPTPEITAWCFAT